MSIFTEKELQKAYLKLVRDTELDKLELALNEPNIFSILSIENMEIRHSNFLGWLLNPKESHGLSDMFLKRFLREIFFDSKIKEVHPLDAEALNYQTVEIRREWRNIDLFIKFSDLIICIENKIWTKDHSEQLRKYKEIINAEYPDPLIKKVFVYLTPYGSSSLNEQETYAFISYQHIIEILDRILSVYKQLITQQSYFYIQDYIKSLKRNLMGTDITNEIAKDIYRNHKRLIDFIYSNRPNAAYEYTEVAREVVKAAGLVIGSEQSHYVRFMSPSLLNLIPKYNKSFGWVKAEALLYEFHFNDRDIFLKITASPSDDQRFRNKIIPILEETLKKKATNWQDWIVIHEQRIAANYKDAKLDRQDVENEIKSYLNKFSPTMKAVEETLLQHQDELIELKKLIENKSE